MKRTGKKALSLVLTLCVIVSLFAGLGMSAYAAASNTQISISSTGATGPTGGGWNWDAAQKILTLAGVDIDAIGIDESAIVIADLGAPVTIVLEGANQLKAKRNGIDSSSALIVKGSGTLTCASNKNGIYMASGKSLTIQSGYLDVSGSSSGVYIRDKLTISGGCVAFTATGSYGKAIDYSVYEQTGGYVKATSAQVGLYGGPTTISGGYLEATGTTGISCAPPFTNSGGVVKAEGTTYAGIMISNTGTVEGDDTTSKASTSFTGGVTIATGAGGGVGNCAITCNNNSSELKHITTANDEQLYDNTGDTPSLVSNTINQATKFLSELTSVVIAKAASSTAMTAAALNGVYIKIGGSTGNSTAWTPDSAASIAASTGSYIEAPGSMDYAVKASSFGLTVNGTLVVNSPKSINASSTLNVGAGGTLYTYAASSYGVNVSALTASGCAINVAGSGNMYNNSITVNDGGYLCGICTGGNAAVSTAALDIKAGGNLTAIGASRGLKVSGATVTFGADATATAVGLSGNATTAYAYSGPEPLKLSGASEKFDPLTKISYSDVVNYKVVLLNKEYEYGPTYTLTVAALGTPSTFTDLSYGYTTGSSVEYTIKNTGNTAVSGLTAALSSGSDYFTVGTPAATSLAPNATTTVTVTSKTGLDASATAYEGTLKVTATENTTGATAALSQTVNKATWSGAVEATVGVMINKTPAPTGTVTAANFFTTAPADAKITAIGAADAALTVLSADPSGGESSGSWAWEAKDALTTEDLTDVYSAVTITSKNYEDITAKLTFKTMDKTPITISGVTVADKTEDGAPVVPNNAGLSVKAGADSISDYKTPLVYTYYKSTGPDTWDAGTTTAPKDAGSYKLVISAAADDPKYAGASEPVPFKINLSMLEEESGNLTDDTISFTEEEPGGDKLAVAGHNTALAAADIGEVRITGPGKNNELLVENTDYTKEDTASVTFTFKEAFLKSLAAGTYDVTAQITGGTFNGLSASIEVVVQAVNNVVVGDYYTLTFETNGGNALVPASFIEGSVVYLAPYQPTRAGYIFDGWYSDAALTKPVSVVLVTGDTIVYAKWTKFDGMPFTDVAEGDWYYNDVAYAFQNGLMKGTGDKEFSPYLATTRGMIVTILYRLENEPAVKAAAPFSDVASGAYYAKAVAWGEANNIVEGYGNGKFGPSDNITREQLAAILWRYAKYKGYDVSVGEDTNILSYKDYFSVSEYAIPALQWACGAGFMQGSDGYLNPGGNALRAQVAAVLHRFCENMK